MGREAINGKYFVDNIEMIGEALDRKRRILKRIRKKGRFGFDTAKFRPIVFGLEEIKHLYHDS